MGKRKASPPTIPSVNSDDEGDGDGGRSGEGERGREEVKE